MCGLEKIKLIDTSDVELILRRKATCSDLSPLLVPRTSLLSEHLCFFIIPNLLNTYVKNNRYAARIRLLWRYSQVCNKRMCSTHMCSIKTQNRTSIIHTSSHVVARLYVALSKFSYATISLSRSTQDISQLVDSVPLEPRESQGNVCIRPCDHSSSRRVP